MAKRPKNPERSMRFADVITDWKSANTSLMKPQTNTPFNSSIGLHINHGAECQEEAVWSNP